MRAGQIARRTAFGGSALGGALALAYGVIRGEAAHARRTIGEPTDVPPDPRGIYGRHRGEPLRLVMIGDSSATGLGCDSPAETPGALLAGGVARELRRPVWLDVVAVVGGRSADLDTQVVHALADGPVDVAVVMVGANDVTHRVRPGEAARDLARAVRTLRAAGTAVVVGTCPDLGTVGPLLQPLKTVAAHWSRRMAAAQAVAVAEEEGVAVTLGSLLAEEFSLHPHLWSADRFHPSAEGYRRVADVLLPAVLEQLGVETLETWTVQDVNVAAHAASREDGVTVVSVEGDDGAAAAGPGRLVRLVRRLPLVNRGEPDERVDDLPRQADGSGVPEEADPVSR